MTFVVSVISAKGGAGKTTTSVNLAAALRDLGQKVTLVDGNLTTPNVSIHLGIPLSPVTLHDVIKKRATIEKATYRHASGIKVVPASISIEDLSAYKPKNFKRALRQLLNKKGIVVIDGAAGLGREARASMEVADGILIVTNPEMPAVADATKAVALARKSKRNVMGVVVNRVKPFRNDMKIGEIEEMIGSEVIGKIPEDKNVLKSIHEKVPLVHHKPYSPASRAFKKLAHELLDEEYNESLMDSIFSLFG